MSELRRKAAQIIFPRLGSNMPPPIRVSEDLDRFVALQKKHQFGGLVLFNGDKTQTPIALKALQEISDSPVLVASDIERGAGQQIQDATLFPHAMACGKAGSDALESFARITAQEALACGIHITFAPIADVNSNPQNPIIGIRALGTTEDEVSRHVTTMVNTFKAEGLLSTAKHFPGHGDTATDSHAELPVVASDKSALQKTELPPFKAAIAAGVELIMTSHVVYPALDPSGKPATLSAPILLDLLKKELDFKGAVISDSLIMKAIHPDHDDMARYAADLLNAGLDILLDPPHPEAMLEGVIEAVQNGLVSMERLDDAVHRVQHLKQQMLDKFGPAVFSNPAEIFNQNEVGNAEHVNQSLDVARKAIEVFKSDDQSSLPAHCLFITPYRTRLDPEETPAGKALKEAFSDVSYQEIDGTTEADALNKILEALPNEEPVLVLAVSKPAAWHAYGLPAHLHAFILQLTEKCPTTIVSLGDPNILKQYNNAQNLLCTYSDVPASQEAIVDFFLSNHTKSPNSKNLFL